MMYYDSWLESNHLYIQMEFCSQNLRSVLKDKPIVFGRDPDEHMRSVFEYFISCEIFRELLECVQYLHESDPPIIHRDLKPDNILILHNISSNRFIKVSDFATDHNTNKNIVIRNDQSGAGTIGYMAPEVLAGKAYNHLSDIYSLHTIGA
ncbi:unnamed protein product, partial [Medioppia subpectinata]